MPESPDNSIPAEDDAIVAVDSACITCGYNLRGLPSNGNCPECGSDKTESLRLDLLQYADARWRRMICWGLSFLVLGFGAVLIAGALSTIAFLLGGVGFFLAYVVALQQPVAWCVATSVFGGFWLAATPDPHSVPNRRQLLLCCAARGATVVGLLCFVFSHVLPAPTHSYIRVAYQVSLFGGVWAVLNLASIIALRIPSATLERRLARRARELSFVGVIVLMALLFHRISMHPASLTAQHVNIFEAGVKAAFGFLMLYTLFAVFVLGLLRQALKKIIDNARTA